jgi:integrase
VVGGVEDGAAPYKSGFAARALEFLILTNVRTDPVLKARWEEIDFDAAVWTVPLKNLKDRKHRKEGFRVPLTSRAMTILSEMSKLSPYIFPGMRIDRPLSNMALVTLIRRMNRPEPRWMDAESGKQVVSHGFRATFRTSAEESTGFPHAVIEEATGHQIGTTVERAYRRTDVLAKRRTLMEAWAIFCEPAAGNVVKMTVA